MRFTRLELKNFRPYFASVSIDLPSSDDKNVILIHGHNGAGKTSLHTAIQWAFYGEHGRRDLFEHANTAARQAEDFEMAVSVSFTHDNHSYVLTRSVRSEKPAVLSPDHLPKSTLSLYRDGQLLSGGEQQYVQDRVEMIVPRDASQFFFFDGEHISRYSANGQSDGTRSAIEQVLGLSAAKQALRDIEKLADETRRDWNRALRNSKTHTELADNHDALKADLAQTSDDLRGAYERVREMQAQRASHEAALEELRDVQVLAAERRGVAEQLTSLRGQLKLVADELQVESRGLYMRILEKRLRAALDAGNKEYEQARARETDSQVVHAVSQFLRSQLDLGVCLCGESLEGHRHATFSEAIKSVAPAVDNVDAESDQSGVRNLAARLAVLRSAYESAERSATRFEDFQVRKSDLDIQVVALERKVVEFDNRIRSIDEQGVNDLRDLIDDLGREIGHAHRDIANFERDLQQKQSSLAETERQIRRLSAASETSAAFGRQVDLLDRTQKALDEFLVRAALARREQMEEKMNGFFKGITNKEAGYQGMFLRDDFTFGISAADGSQPNMDQIAAGEKQVVAFAFILGLNQYARSMAPLMIDTPMSRLDQEHRRNLAKTIVDMPQQVFMFVTDTDLGFGVQDIIEGSVAAEFRITQDPKALTSAIAAEGEKL